MTTGVDDCDDPTTVDGDSAEFDNRFDVPLCGVDVDAETRCEHYHADRDVIAIKFPCCGVYHPCFECHETLADHEPERWSLGRFDEPAVLCGVCGERLTVAAYLDADHACPSCSAEFNPGCALHAHLYFDAA
ncbi:CHY zinc finger protein [Haloprofundus salilacus]|uniref:CHY zinc finger protein n=1 Tax=Haloprofundus salilacus TaxID=2876190 RepID=UPI001CCB7D11|nr:CHY zinc finger protein [Haloprofundus salilacus]